MQAALLLLAPWPWQEWLKGRYKVAILVSAGFVAWIGLAGSHVCILVAGPQPSWLGSYGGCGPLVTYEFQKYFGILWYDAEGEDIRDAVKRMEMSVMVSEYRPGTHGHVTVDAKGDILSASPSVVAVGSPPQGAIWASPADRATGVSMPSVGL